MQERRKSLCAQQLAVRATALAANGPSPLPNRRRRVGIALSVMAGASGVGQGLVGLSMTTSRAASTMP